MQSADYVHHNQQIIVCMDILGIDLDIFCSYFRDFYLICSH